MSIKILADSREQDLFTLLEPEIGEAEGPELPRGGPVVHVGVVVKKIMAELEAERRPGWLGRED